MASIRIGPRTSVQDNVVVHTEADGPTVIGMECTVGHGAIVHDSTIGDNVLIGSGAVLVGGNRVGDRSIVAAGAVLPDGMAVPGRKVVVGVPARAVRVPHEQLRALQRNLVRSHAVGVGPLLPEESVRAVLLLRANTLAAGRSGVRAEVIDLLCDMLNRRVHPAIPMHGSVGASGDLAPLAHAALVLIGEGETVASGVRRAGGDALKAAGLKRIE